MAEQRKYSEEDEDLPEIDLSSEDSNSPLATRQTMGAAGPPERQKMEGAPVSRNTQYERLPPMYPPEAEGENKATSSPVFGKASQRPPISPPSKEEDEAYMRYRSEDSPSNLISPLIGSPLPKSKVGPNYSPRESMVDPEPEMPKEKKGKGPSNCVYYLLFLMILVILFLLFSLQNALNSKRILEARLASNNVKLRVIEQQNEGLNMSIGMLEEHIAASYATANENNNISIWNKDLEVIRELSGHSDQVLCLETLHSGMLASGSKDGHIQLWSLSSFVQMGILGKHSKGVLRLLQLRNGYLASGSWDTTVKIWNPYNRELIYTLQGHKGPINSLGELPEEGLLWSGSRRPENMTIIWDLSTGKRVRSLTPHEGSVREILPLPDGNALTIGMHSDKCIKVWTPRGELIRYIRCTQEDQINRAILYSHGTQLITASATGYIKLWDIQTGEIFLRINAFTQGVFGLQLISQGKIIACSKDKTIKIIDIEKGIILKELQGGDGSINDIVKV